MPKQNPSPRDSKSKPTQRVAATPSRIGLWITLAVSLLYCIWLGWHWLPLGYSDKELAAFVSRVWDIQRELTEHHRLPWWTPYYMSGSSYGLNHAQGFYLVPWLVLAQFFSLPVAGKLVALGAIFAGAVAMYFCARYFLRDEWAAALAGLAFLLHPEQVIRAASAEHIGVIVFFPFIPLAWWTFARALDSGRFRDVFWCAIAVAGLMWTHNKQAFVQFIFLGCYLMYRLWPADQRRKWRAAGRTCIMIGIVALGLGAFFIVPGLVEAKYVKLFYGDPIEGWQRNYAFKSLLGLVDRDGVVTRTTIQSVVSIAQSRGVPNEDEAEKVRRVISLQSDSPEKYAGIVLLAVVAATAVSNRRRADRGLFWLMVAMLIATVMLASGLNNVWTANLKTWRALFALVSVPPTTRMAVFACEGIVVAFLMVFAHRKLTTTRKKIFAGVALAVFLVLPAFKLLALLPFFKEIRAPFVFYDLPAVFFGAMLAGFFVTDVLVEGKWAPHRKLIVVVAAALMLLDYWPYQRSMKDNGVPARTLQNLQSTYASLRNDPDWVKTYSMSGRYFHLLGPMYGGKPQVWEAFYNWMAPLGIGLLNQHANLDFFNLVGARYIVFDKTDGQTDLQIAANLRRVYPVALENEDFVVFRNENARPYVTGYERACAFTGDVRKSPELALALAAKNWPLVQLDSKRGSDTPAIQTVFADAQSAPIPAGQGKMVALRDVTLSRDSSGEIRIELTAPTACWTVIAESYYPFWRAAVDGQDAHVARVSCGLMGLEMAAGQHTIVLRYEQPRTYAVATWFSAIALLACIGVIIWEARRTPAG